VWIMSFINYNLGCFNLESNKIQVIVNPFGPKAPSV
jgi:hypothetical protein